MLRDWLASCSDIAAMGLFCVLCVVVAVLVLVLAQAARTWCGITKKKTDSD